MNLAQAQALLPEFHLNRTLEPGAQGAVFVGRSQDGHPTVVKVIEGAWTKRGAREIEALRMVDHPAVVRLLANGTVKLGTDEQVYLATAYVEGEDLAKKLKAGTLDCRSMARILVSVSAGLDAMWEQRIIHRDIKPANIMVRPDGSGVLLDLGVALCRALSALTAWGVPGTPGYMSPEQCMGVRALTVKSDVFALGVTAYEALAGVHPFGRNQQLIAQGGVAPQVPASVGCSKRMAGVISSMLNHSAAFRPMPHEIIGTLASEGL